MEPDFDRFIEAEAVLITGPTAGGKSTLALDIAERVSRAGRDAIIVNADSMQVYEGLHILTARPDERDEARCRHLLYGHADPVGSLFDGAMVEGSIEYPGWSFGRRNPHIHRGNGALFSRR